MRESLMKESRWGLLLSLFVLGLITAATVLPYQFRTEAGSQGEKKGLSPKTTSEEEGIDDYDIRLDKEAADKLMQFRQAAGKDAVVLASLREQFVRAEETLRRRVESLKVDYSEHLRVPEVIGPNVLEGMIYMTGPSAAKRPGILRGFAKENNELIGMPDSQIDQLKTTADYTNPDGNASWVVLEQYIGEIPMFHGELKAGFTKDGRMVRAISGLAPGLEYESLSRDFGDPLNAVRSAAGHIKHELRQSDVTRNGARSTELNVVYGEGPYATTARKYYFPTEAGVARAAWLVTIWKDVPAYEVMVDAETGALLWRHNMVKDQTQPVTYTVWANTTSPMFSLDSPAPFTPGTIDPSDPTQGPLQPRISVTRIGNEPPYTFNNLGWMNDSTNALEGNNVQAGLDRDTIQGPDLPLITGSGARVFNFASNPPPGNPPPGDDPLPPGDTPTPCDPAPPPVIDSQRAAVTQMFYVVNRYHDVLYLGGFTEQARNFQLDNFGRGGIGNDRIIAEGQDCSGTNGASMASSSTDGTTARMVMLIFTTPTQDRDSILDAEVMLHEIGHGVTNRLHTLGIGGTQGAQMHEGNGDFLAHLLLSETTDPADGTGTYPMGGYLVLFSGTSNYYYGLRRYPRAVIAFRGGPGNLPHNPLTYADIDPAQFNPGGGAFPPRFNGSPTGGHDGGEIWSGMLWEVRARLIQRLGHTAGTSKMLQIMLDGMKLAAANPRMLHQRDSILVAAQVSGTAADVADVWAGFAARGMGFSAQNPSGNTVVEAFDVPKTSDAPGKFDFDADGRTDISVWRPADGNWHVLRSTDGYAAYTWGASSDQIVPGDFDGDGKADVAVWRPSTGAWYILNSNGGTYSTYTWGASDDVPVVGDYDDDGKADVAVYRPPNASWHILRSSDGGYTNVTWAVMGDVPVAGDFDGDGQTDIAVRRPSSGEWFIRRSTGGVISVRWGVGTDIPVHADYDGDGKDDVAVWRPSTGGWFILRSMDGGYTQATWGAAGDVPVPGDYDGDGRADISVVRNGVWHISQSTDGYRTATWGVGTDIAIPGRY